MSLDVLFGGVLYWFVFGFVYLARLVYQDYKKMLVDDRLNYFMLGLTFSLLTHVSRSLWYLLLVIVLVFVLEFFARRYKMVGLGDLSAMRWILLGLGYLNPFVLGLFVCFWVLIHCFYVLIKTRLFKLGLSVKTPYFGVIFVSFVITSAFYLGGVYLL